MLEIGVDNKDSLWMWLDYFENVFVYGIEYGAEIHETTDKRYKVFIADQSNHSQCVRIISELSHLLFLVIDDGSHLPVDQLSTFEQFFDVLIPGGTYIIEDIETSYWANRNCYPAFKYNYGYHQPHSVVEVMKQVADEVSRDHKLSN